MAQMSALEVELHEDNLNTRNPKTWLAPVAQMSALEVEELRGDNQYRCDLCRTMVDATRQLRLRQLPPYLCLSLKRFVFDLRVGPAPSGAQGLRRGCTGCQGLLAHLSNKYT